MNTYYYGLAKRAAEIVGPPIQPLWIYAQWRHETANFTSELCIYEHNLGGITQIAENSNPQPDGSFYYMSFNSDADFAEYFGRYLTLYEGINECYTIEDYVSCLQAGGYFGDSYDNYLKGVKFYEEA